MRVREGSVLMLRYKERGDEILGFTSFFLVQQQQKGKKKQAQKFSSLKSRVSKQSCRRTFFIFCFVFLFSPIPYSFIENREKMPTCCGMKQRTCHLCCGTTSLVIGLVRKNHFNKII
jgi:hypothetical protein